MTEVSFRVLKHFFFGRVEKLSVSPAHFTPVSGQLFRFYSADCRSNSSIITFRNQYFNESSIARGFHLGRHLFGFHLIKDVTESKVCAQLYVPASDRAFFHVHAKHRQLKRHLHATSPSRTAARIAASTIARSEEHTSELQSPMRTSYAVFGLKKKLTILHTLPNTLITQQTK